MESKEIVDIFLLLQEKCKTTPTKVTTLNYVDNFINIIYPSHYDTPLTTEWVSLFLTALFQNELSKQTYFNKQWAIYLSNLLTQKGIKAFQKVDVDKWRFFINRDIFKTFNFTLDIGDKVPLINTKEIPQQQTKIPYIKSVDKSLFHDLFEAERNTFLNTEFGYHHCLTEDIHFNKKSIYCPTCKYKEECQKRKK